LGIVTCPLRVTTTKRSDKACRLYRAHEYYFTLVYNLPASMRRTFLCLVKQASVLGA
jgi:hypothetical protein